MKDKYTAVWVSHSSIGDFIKCPRAYFLKNVYKDPKSGNKLQITGPSLSLGQVVHEVIESLSVIPTSRRFETPLIEHFEEAWKKVSGKRGGFMTSSIEHDYKERGIKMLERVKRNPGPLKNLAVKIDMDLPHFWLSEDENIILCGKIDWLEYFQDTDTVHIIDFKTSMENKEDPDSLQLPIYHLLVKNTQRREVTKASYWYLEQDDAPVEKELPDYDESFNKVLSIARKIKLARQLDSFKCPNGDEGCRDCKPMEKILKGEAELVAQEFKKDIYVLNYKEEKPEGTIL
ncbi:MAG TPA: PD-(D/E)XK nuclease family protein [Candidatus Dojkabacteria bacterium]|nr:PD-(D/E)XK nuclease family protein [Candidatus Dojkabacteria bacterium]